MRTIRNLVVVAFIFVLSVLFLAPCQASFEGYWLQTVISESDMPMTSNRSDTREQKVFYRSGMITTVDFNSGDMTIFRLDKELMWQVNVEESTYTEITFDEMEQISAEGKKKMAEMKAEMEEQMKDMPPEQRKLVEKMMKGKMSALMGDEDEAVEISLRRTGEKEKVGGYDCERVIITANEDPLVEMWVMDAFDIGSELFTFYEKIKLFKYEPTEDIKQFKGFPMKMIFTMDMGIGSMKNVSTVSKVVKTSLNDSDFEVPRGFRKVRREMIQPE